MQDNYIYMQDNDVYMYRYLCIHAYLIMYTCILNYVYMQDNYVYMYR